jgi:glycosyltransferase involved in cell wall biosynthesis
MFMRRIIVAGHSMVAPRQQRFWEYISSMGYDVLVLAPKVLGPYRICDREKDSFKLKAVDLAGSGGRIRGLKDLIDEFVPDFLYLNDEVDAGLVLQACQLKKENKFTLALFSWENIMNQHGWEKLLSSIDLFVPGCPGARSILLSKGIPAEKMSVEIIQVGVDTELFTPMPENAKQFDTVTGSRFTDRKGICEIQQAVRELNLRHLWLGRSDNDELSCQMDYGLKGWTEYEELPYWYNRAKTHVLFSKDTPTWKEQFTYSIAETLSCGLFNVISNAGEWPYFWLSAPGTFMVGHYIEQLKEGIKHTLDLGTNIEGRKYVQKNFSFEVTATRLLRLFQGW